jgi:hypothetical protein
LVAAAVRLAILVAGYVQPIGIAGPVRLAVLVAIQLQPIVVAGAGRLVFWWPFSFNRSGSPVPPRW